jgi:hypothetical protein
MTKLAMTRRCWRLGSLLLMAGVVRAADAPATIAGTFKVEGGASTAEWRLYALPEPSSERPWNVPDTAVGADGGFTLRGVAPGPCYVCAYCERFLDLSSVVRVQPEAGQTAAGLEVAVKAPRARVEFDLLNHDKTPLGHVAKVHLFGPWGRFDASTCGTSTDAAGVATYAGLPAGHYDVWVEGGQIYHQIEITSGAGTQHVPLVADAVGEVHGRVLLADGKTPARGCIVSPQTGVSLDPATGCAAAEFASGALTCYSEAEVDAAGNFTLRNVVAGTLMLDVRRPGDGRAWTSVEATVPAGGAAEAVNVVLPAAGWRSLFDGVDLTGWKEADLFGRQPVRVEHGWMTVPQGDDMSGLVWAGAPLPKTNYEVTLQGMRTEGHDFWCGLTFPVGDDPLTLVLGGWGGSVCGLSSLDGEDAANNATSQMNDFDPWRWYRVRLRVTPERVEAWLDDKPLVNQELKEHRLSVRMEVEPCKPFGLATWRTTGAIRDLRLRPL